MSGPVNANAHVRAAGHDIRVGDAVALPAPLTPAAIGVLGSLGLAEIEVRARPRVAIVSSGDELTDPGTPLPPGHIYDANAPALAAAVSEMGGEPHRPDQGRGRARRRGGRAAVRGRAARTSSSPPVG